MELLDEAQQIIIRQFSASGDRANKGPRRTSLVKSAVFFYLQGNHVVDWENLNWMAGYFVRWVFPDWEFSVERRFLGLPGAAFFAKWLP